MTAVEFLAVPDKAEPVVPDFPVDLDGRAEGYVAAVARDGLVEHWVSVHRKGYPAEVGLEVQIFPILVDIVVGGYGGLLAVFVHGHQYVVDVSRIPAAPDRRDGGVP